MNTMVTDGDLKMVVMDANKYTEALKQAEEAGYLRGKLEAEGISAVEKHCEEKNLAKVSSHQGQDLTLTLKTKDTERND